MNRLRIRIILASLAFGFLTLGASLFILTMPSRLCDWISFINLENIHSNDGVIIVRVSDSHALEFHSAQVDWRWGRDFPYLSPVFRLNPPRLIDPPSPVIRAPIPDQLTRVRVMIGAAIVKLRDGVDLAGFPPNEWTGRCSRTGCSLNLFEGAVEISTARHVIFRNINIKLASEKWRQLSHLSGLLSGTVSTHASTIEFNFDGLELSPLSFQEANALNIPIVGSVEPYLSSFLNIPVKVTGQMQKSEGNLFLHKLEILSSSGKISTTSAIPLTSLRTGLPLRWYPHSNKISRDIAEALTDPGGSPSLSFIVSFQEDGLKWTLDQEEIERKGKAWLSTKIKSINKEKIIELLSRFKR